MTDRRWHAELSQSAKRLLLEQILGERVGRPKVYPAALSQRRLWFFEQMEPGSSVYNNCVVLDLFGRLDRDALGHGLDAVIRRHESLRTTFQVRDGEPVQVVSPGLDLQVVFDDLRSAAPDAGQSTLEDVLLRESLAPFDLERGPLVRARLVQVDDEHHVLAITIHHIVSDGWSIMVVLLRELFAFYREIAAGREPILQPLPMQYGEYAVWQRDVLRGDRLEAALSFWRSALGSAPEPLLLPTDRPRPRVQTFRGRSCSIALKRAVSEDILRVGREHGATPFMVLLATFGALLGRHSGQERVLVGSPITGRTLSEVEGLVGFFVNTLPLPVDVVGDASLEELLRSVGDTARQAYLHQDLPFDRIVEALHPSRDVGRTPLFQVMLNMLGFAREELDPIPGLRVAMRAAPMATSKFDLTVYATPRTDGLSLALVYNADLFDDVRMTELLDQYVLLLEQALARPRFPMSGHTLISSRARPLLPDPTTPVPDPERSGLLTRLSRTASERSERTALTSAKATWSHGLLDTRANRLAAGLARCGLGRGDVVAIWAHRDPMLVCAILGILKAGAAFTILDPGYPEARLAACWRASSARGILVLDEAPDIPAALSEELSARSPLVRWCLSSQTIDRDLADLPAAAPAIEVDADTAAYVAYTSGTTGGVKAILGTHGPLVHFLDWHARSFSLGADDHFAMLSGLSHDPLLRDVLAPLWVGATLHVPDPERLGEPGWLGAWLATEGVTVAHLTPAMSELVTSDSRRRHVPVGSLRWAFFGGDVLTHGTVERMLEVAPNAVCVNFYGATETPQAMGYSVVARDRPEPLPYPAQVVPVGRGIDDVQLLVLNRQGLVAGVGELGEIVVRTPHLARGYIGDDTLTLERFVANPFSGEPRDRLYRTGDLGRYRPDGMVEFAGRADSQVKVRGFRVELGEIEALLREHTAVQDAVAALSTVAPGDQRLAGFVVPALADGVRWTELSEFLRGRLPEHSVPTAWAAIESVPLTPNGKVDRRSLPVPAVTRQLDGDSSLRTPTEELLADIWSEVLSVAKVGRADGFFDLGGHSLLATQVLSRVRDRLGTSLPMRAIFEAATLADLAARIDEARGPTGSSQPPLVRMSQDEPAPLSFAQQRLWFLHELAPKSAAYNLAGALDLRGELDAPVLEEALARIGDRHESLRVHFDRVNGQPAQAAREAGRLSILRVAAPSVGRTREDLDTLMADEASRPFDLESGELLRVTLYEVGKQEHTLLFVAHHIATDGWSMGIFARELTELYDALVTGRDAVLPDLPIRYSDYARWQRQWLRGDALEHELAHWRARLDGAPRVLELPADRPRPATETHRGARLSRVLPPDLRDGLAALGRREGATLFMVLLAAFEVLVSRHTGQDDMLVGSPVANRGRAETENLIGFFVNTLVLRGDLRGDPTFEDLLGRVREICLDAYAHQDLPFEKLVEALHPERDLSRNPLFQVMFALQNMTPPDVRLKGLAVSGRELERRSAQVDLTLFMQETPEGLRATFEYATDLFEAATIDRMASRLQALLRGIVAAPDSRISELPILTDAERATMAGWNDTGRAYPLARRLHELIEEQVVRTPDRMAVKAEEGHLTYGELDARANQLARHLRSLGVGPEILVGVAMERSPEMVVALLGILKAGGAYVPLDPTYPRERLSFMMGDARVSVLLTQERLLGGLPESGAPVLALDAGWPKVAEESAERPKRVGTSEDLSYVIYTSGSTGKPKGAMNCHRGIVNRLLWMQEAYGLGPEDVVLQKTPFSFDVSVWEFFWPLLAGARLVMARPEGHKDPSYLVRTIVDEGVTTIHFVPAMLQAFLEEPDLERCASLKRVVCSGEALPAELCKRFHERLDCELHNLYGPTEAAVDVTYFHCRRDERGSSVPIGRPVANVRVYVLGPDLEPVPIGVAGELHLGGVQVGRGYLGRPDLTAERFIPDPFEGEGGRLYKTGDLARLLPDGNVEYLGRLDHQVKIRGFRVELGEIEAAIARHPAVREAVVLAREDRPGDRRLVAYVVAPEAASPVEDDLRSGLRAELPDYMVPSAIVLLDALPLSPNGKIDRKALPAPEDGGSRPSQEFVAPATETERIVSALWSAVLGKAQVGVEDNFFDLGGNSILLLQAVARTREAGLEITPLHMFRHPTVRALSRHLHDAGGGSRSFQQVRDRARQQRQAMARGKRAPWRDRT